MLSSTSRDLGVRNCMSIPQLGRILVVCPLGSLPSLRPPSWSQLSLPLDRRMLKLLKNCLWGWGGDTAGITGPEEEGTAGAGQEEGGSWR